MDKIVGHIKVNRDCSNIDDLPNVSLIIENVDYVLTPYDYVIESIA